MGARSLRLHNCTAAKSFVLSSLAWNAVKRTNLFSRPMRKGKGFGVTCLRGEFEFMLVYPL